MHNAFGVAGKIYRNLEDSVNDNYKFNMLVLQDNC